MKRNSLYLTAALVWFLTGLAQAHFPWLIVNQEGKAALFFGESIADRTYRLPDAIAEAEILVLVDGKSGKAQLVPVASDEFVGLVSKQDIEEGAQLQTQVTYGIYHGNRLNYRSTHHCGPLPKEVSKVEKTEGFKVQLVATESGGVDAFVYWNGEPMPEIEVHLYCAEGHEEATASTDHEGRVSFTGRELEDGLNGIMFGHTIQDAAGKLGDEAYSSTMFYCTATFECITDQDH